MRVLVTGHDGYLGSVVFDRLGRSGHQVIGLDNFAARPRAERPQLGSTSGGNLYMDVRAISPRELERFDAVVHLAAIDGDAAGEADPATTLAVNHLAARSLAQAAKLAGVERFLFASSYKVYPASDRPVDEETPLAPRSTFGVAKARAEDSILALASDSFAPTVLRIGSVYGPAPRMRYDLVVNNLTASAVTTGEVLLQSAGTAFCPIVHIRDVAETIRALLRAPNPHHVPVLNVGSSTDSYRVRMIAQLVQEVVPHSMVQFTSDANADPRTHFMNCARLRRAFPNLPSFVEPYDGIIALYRELRRIELSPEDSIDHATDRAAHYAIDRSPKPTTQKLHRIA